MGDISPTQQRHAALANKRRVRVAERCNFTLGHQVITKTPDQVIEDPHVIAMLEQNGIDLIDLDFNGRPTLSPKQKDKADAERGSRVDALASALDLPPTTLQEALDKGGYEATSTVRTAVQEIHTREIRSALQLANDRNADLEARIVELESQLKTARDAAADSAGSATSGKSGKGKSGSNAPSIDDLTS